MAANLALTGFSGWKSSLGQIGRHQQQKWLWHGWGVMPTVWQCFKSFILTYKVRKNTAFLHCIANQAGTGYKLNFQPKNPAWAKLAAINNKNGCGTAEVWCKQFRKYFVSLLLSYKARKKTTFLRCSSNQAGTDHKLHFQPKNPARAKLAAINK